MTLLFFLFFFVLFFCFVFYFSETIMLDISCEFSADADDLHEMPSLFFLKNNYEKKKK